MTSPFTITRDEGCVNLTGHVRLKQGLWPVCKTVSFRLTKAVPLFPVCELGRVEFESTRSSALGFDRPRLTVLIAILFRHFLDHHRHGVVYILEQRDDTIYI